MASFGEAIEKLTWLKPNLLFSSRGFIDQSGMMEILETFHQLCLDKGIAMPIILMLDFTHIW